MSAAPWVAVAGIIVCAILACTFAVIEVRRSFRIVRRAQRIAAARPEAEPTVIVRDEVLS